jgi:hypothetical protein
LNDVSRACLLEDLCHCEDIWEIVCSWLDGDALYRVDAVSSTFRAATRSTPAFALLAGINDDAKLVPWLDSTNVLSGHYRDTPCEICKVFDCRHHYDALWDREISAIQVAEAMFKDAHLNCPIYLRVNQSVYPSPLDRCGPSRPSTPNDAALTSYVPLIEPRDAPHFFNPPVFGIRPGFTHAPFWSVMVAESLSDSD